MSDERRTMNDERARMNGVRPTATQRSSVINHGPSSVELQIDELVLHGFAPGDGAAIGAALRAELARLITEGGVSAWLTEGAEATALDGGSFGVTADMKSEAIGKHVAQAVYKGLQQ